MARTGSNRNNELNLRMDDNFSGVKYREEIVFLNWIIHPSIHQS